MAITELHGATLYNMCLDVAERRGDLRELREVNNQLRRQSRAGLSNPSDLGKVVREGR